jgi:predicted DNA-binding protein YlxM (UPF0122 family)
MTAEHFYEYILTISMTKNLSLPQIADIIGVSKTAIYTWMSKGIPKRRSVRVVKILREYCMEA